MDLDLRVSELLDKGLGPRGPDSDVPGKRYKTVDDAVAEAEVESSGGSWAPTAVRIGAGLVGGTVGGIVGGPAGAALGGAAGSSAGDALAQMIEMQEGTRTEFNPALNVVEAVTGAIPGIGKTVPRAALAAGAFGAGSFVASEVAEGRPIPEAGQLALVGITSAFLGGGLKSLSNRIAMRHGVEGLTDDVNLARPMDSLTDDLLDPDIARIKATLEPVTAGSGKWDFDQVDADTVRTLTAKAANWDATGGMRVDPKLPKGSKSAPTAHPIMGVLRHVIPQEVTMQRLQEQTGLPLYDDSRVIRTLFDVHKTETSAAADDLASIFSGSSKKTHQKLNAAFRAFPGLDRDALMDANHFSTKERKMVRQLEGFYQRYSDKLGIGPESIKELENETDELTRAVRYASKASFDFHVKDEWEVANKKWAGLKENPIAKQSMMTFLNAIRGQPSETIEALDKGFQRIFGKDLLDTRQLASNFTALTYSSALGFRPASAIRNAFGAIQTMTPLAGVKYTAEGFREAMTVEGRAIALTAGVTKGQAIDLAEVSAIGSNLATRGIQAVARTSLRGFEVVEEFVRAGAYLGFRRKAMDAAKVAGGDIGKWVDLADVDRLHQAPREMLERLYASGNRKAAVDLFAKIQVMNTQFDYSAAGRAPAFTGLGQTVAGFATWPTSYATYLVNNFASPAGPAKKVWRDFARWGAVNASIAGGFAAAGSALGDEDSIQDNLGFTFLAPAFYTGGPGLEMIQGMLEAGRNAATGKFKEAGSEFRQAFRLFEEPGIVRDVRQAREEGTGEEALGRILGLKRGKQ